MRVCVIGSPMPATDPDFPHHSHTAAIAVQSSFVARSTYLAARRGAWVISKHLFGRPLDTIPTPEPDIAALAERTIRNHLPQPLGAIMPLAELQSQWTGDHLPGRPTLPSDAELRADVAAERRAMFERYVRSERHTTQIDVEDHVVGLERERRRGATR